MSATQDKTKVQRYIRSVDLVYDAKVLIRTLSHGPEGWYDTKANRNPARQVQSRPRMFELLHMLQNGPSGK